MSLADGKQSGRIKAVYSFSATQPPTSILSPVSWYLGSSDHVAVTRTYNKDKLLVSTKDGSSADEEFLAARVGSDLFD